MKKLSADYTSLARYKTKTQYFRWPSLEPSRQPYSLLQITTTSLATALVTALTFAMTWQVDAVSSPWRIARLLLLWPLSDLRCAVSVAASVSCLVLLLLGLNSSTPWRTTAAEATIAGSLIVVLLPLVVAAATAAYLLLVGILMVALLGLILAVAIIAVPLALVAAIRYGSFRD